MLLRLAASKTSCSLLQDVDSALNSARDPPAMLFSPASGSAPRRVAARPGMPATGVAHLRRQQRRVALADEDRSPCGPSRSDAELDCEMPRAPTATPGGECARRRCVGIERVALFDVVARLVVELAALELLDRADDALVVRASASTASSGVSGYITATRSFGPSWFCNELDQRLARPPCCCRGARDSRRGRTRRCARPRRRPRSLRRRACGSRAGV